MRIAKTIEQRAFGMRASGMTYPQIAKEAKVSLSWCKTHLKSTKIKGPYNPRNRKGNASVLLGKDPICLYWIGFLMADGTFHKRGRMRATLALKDWRHLKKLKRFLSISSPMKLNRGRYPSVSISLMDSNIIRKLMSVYDINPNKTEHPCKLTHLSKEELFCLSIGFIDGDGSIKKVSKRRHSSLYIKCHNSWLNNLTFMFPQGRTKINSKGYAETSITNTTILKRMKIKAQSLHLPLMSRKWDRVEVDFISRQETRCQYAAA